MEKYFANIENGIVKRVIVAENVNWCTQNLGGHWVETSQTDDKNYAGIDYEYNVEKNNFIAPKPFESWILNEKERWAPPIQKSEDINGKFWSEKTQSFKSIEEIVLELK